MTAAQVETDPTTGLRRAWSPVGTYADETTQFSYYQVVRVGRGLAARYYVAPDTSPYTQLTVPTRRRKDAARAAAVFQNWLVAPEWATAK